jgi:hypothetical protein
MATSSKSAGGDRSSKTGDVSVEDVQVDQSEGAGDDVTVTVGSDTTTEAGDVSFQHWTHPEAYKGAFRIGRGDRELKYAGRNRVD